MYWRIKTCHIKNILNFRLNQVLFLYRNTKYLSHQIEIELCFFLLSYVRWKVIFFSVIYLRLFWWMVRRRWSGHILVIVHAELVPSCILNVANTSENVLHLVWVWRFLHRNFTTLPNSYGSFHCNVRYLLPQF